MGTMSFFVASKALLIPCPSIRCKLKMKEEVKRGAAISWKIKWELREFEISF
jgi:hypothetical protein